jgi:hypothetical protein
LGWGKEKIHNTKVHFAKGEIPWKWVLACIFGRLRHPQEIQQEEKETGKKRMETMKMTKRNTKNEGRNKK